MQEAAYESLLKRTRQQLHGRVVDVLRERFPERVESEPEVVARHAEAAGRSDDAITYYGRAGERAQARSAHEEAIGQLRKAIGLLETRPAGTERDARELSLQLALGGSLIAARGYAHPETAAAYERAAALGAAAGDAARLGVARTGLSICYHNRGEVERGRALAAEVLAAAEARGDREQALFGHTNVAVPEHWQGKFASSLAHCERAIALYDPVQHHGHVRVLGNDQGISALNFSAWNLWYLGQPDAALARAREAVALARRLDDPFSLAFALFFETVVHWHRRDVAAQRERATEVVALSEAQGFPFWLGARARIPRRGPRHGWRSRRAPRDHGRLGARRRDGKPGGCARDVCPSGRSTASRRPARRGAGHGRDRPGRRRTDGPALLRRRPPPPRRRPAPRDRRHRRRGGRPLSPRPRHRPRAGGPLVRAARRDEPRAPVARSGQARRSARPPRPGLRAGSPKASTRAT